MRLFRPNVKLQCIYAHTAPIKLIETKFSLEDKRTVRVEIRNSDSLVAG